MSQDLLTQWRIENLRFSVFLEPPTEPGPVASWTAVVGEASDDTRIKGTGDQRIVRQQGPFAGARMRADVRTNRIDWHLLPSPPETPSSRRTAGPYGDLKDRFRDTMLAWLDATHPLANRMAYGARLSLGGGSRSDALTVLARLLATVEVDPRNTWDFEYTVNRRRDSKAIAGLMINRLAKWSMGQEIFGAIELPAGDEQPRMKTTTAYLPILTLDVNSMPEFPGPFDRPGELLMEFASLGTEIALEGDVP